MIKQSFHSPTIIVSVASSNFYISLLYSTENSVVQFQPLFWPQRTRHVFAGTFTIRKRKKIFLSLSLSLLSLLTPRHERALRRYLHFYAWVCFSSGNRNSASAVDSQHRTCPPVYQSHFSSSTWHGCVSAARTTGPPPTCTLFHLSLGYEKNFSLLLICSLTSFEIACILKENTFFWSCVIHCFCSCH